MEKIFFLTAVVYLILWFSVSFIFSWITNRSIKNALYKATIGLGIGFVLFIAVLVKENIINIPM